MILKVKIGSDFHFKNRLLPEIDDPQRTILYQNLYELIRPIRYIT